MLKIIHNPFGNCSSSMSGVDYLSQEMQATSDMCDFRLPPRSKW